MKNNAEVKDLTTCEINEINGGCNCICWDTKNKATTRILGKKDDIQECSRHCATEFGRYWSAKSCDQASVLEHGYQNVL